MMGSMAAFGALTLKGLRGCAGVPKAGEDEGRTDEEGGGACLWRNIGAGVLSILERLEKGSDHVHTSTKAVEISPSW